MSQGNLHEGFITYRNRYEVIKRHSDLTRTKQEFKDECDINLIVPKWESTGLLNHQSAHPPTYGDFSDSMEYQSAMNSLISAQQAFADLPSEIRERMHNDPGKLLDFLADEDNRDEAIRIGLIKKPVEDPSTPAPQEPAEPIPPITGGE